MNRHLLTIIAALASLTLAKAQVPAGVQAVDLGLPNGQKWASCNVGATTPEGYGNYYAWGETETRDDYSWATYKHNNGVNSSDNITKYGNNADTLTTLEPEDDAATAKWGSAWRMPTAAEMDELLEHCTWTWTTQNGINGYQVASKTNGNSIFLPAAGCSDGTVLKGAGSYGNYWYSSLYGIPCSAWSLDLLSDGIDRTGYFRSYGFSVRPVQESGTGTGFGYTAIADTAAARKVLRNGQVLIFRNSKTYTILGQ